MVVSIPRSGFCSFRQKRMNPDKFTVFCFNPSVGILFVQTGILGLVSKLGDLFQSLGRDSVRSDVIDERCLAYVLVFQSLGRDSVRSDLTRIPINRILVRFQSLGRDSVRSDFSVSSMSLFLWKVSIPRSGFCSFRPGQ